MPLTSQRLNKLPGTLAPWPYVSCFTPFVELGADGRYAGCYHFIYSSFHRFTGIWSYGRW